MLGRLTAGSAGIAKAYKSVVDPEFRRLIYLLDDVGVVGLLHVKPASSFVFLKHALKNCVILF
jgi:hypothetical protein